jgi:ribosomal protein S28E/S33
MNSNFPPHGELAFYRDGRILVANVRGPWNLELIYRWAEDISPHASELAQGGVWGSICIIEVSILSTPDAMRALQKTVEGGVKNFQFGAQAIVAASGVAGRGFVENSFRHLYHDLCPFEFFEDYASAKLWVSAQVPGLR